MAFTAPRHVTSRRIQCQLMPGCSALTPQMVNERATAPHKSAPTSRNPAVRQAGWPSAGRTERASRSRLPVAADNPPSLRLHMPDTSTANRPSPNPFGCKPRACGMRPAFRRGWEGEGKPNRCLGAGQRAHSDRHTGATILLWEMRGQSPWRSRHSNERRRSASPTATRHKNGTLARRDANGPAARRLPPKRI
jgi:hypothetical protein